MLVCVDVWHLPWILYAGVCRGVEFIMDIICWCVWMCGIYHGYYMLVCVEALHLSWILYAGVCSKVGNRPVNMHIDQTSGHYWF